MRVCPLVNRVKYATGVVRILFAPSLGGLSQTHLW